MEVKEQSSEGSLSSMASSQNEQTNNTEDGADLKCSKREDTSFKSGLVARWSFRDSKRGYEKYGNDEDAMEMKSPGKRKSNIIRRVSGSFGSFRVKNRRKSDPYLPLKSDNGNTTETRGKIEEVCEDGSSGFKIYSVMEVYELIRNGKLQEAYSIIQRMEKELLEEDTPEASDNSCSDHNRRVKDVEYLYKHLVEKMRAVIKDTLGKGSLDAELLRAVVNVIGEEEGQWIDHQQMTGTLSNTLGSPRKWKDVWKETVEESVKERINSVLLASEKKECVALHLTLVTKRVIGDLLKVKGPVKTCYTENFGVCDTYMHAFHRMVSRHITDNLLSRSLEFKDLHSVLAWVTNTYQCESLMGNPDLKPEFNTEILGPLLDADVLDKLQSNYLISLKATIAKYMENFFLIQNKNWARENEPDIEILDGIYTSELYIDIQEMIGQHVIESGNISEYLKNETLRVCFGEVAQIIPRLAEEFICWDQTKSSPLFMKYFVTYINGFCGIRSKLKTTDTTESKELEAKITSAIKEFKKYFFKKLEQKTQPLFQKLLTTKWMSSNEAFQKLDEEVSLLSQDLQHLGLPAVKDFLTEVHKYLVKEYISQIMKQRLRLKRTNRGEAADKMREEGEFINRKITKLGSESDWLCPAIPLISEVVGIKEEESMKAHLKQLVSQYPDLSEEHVSTILYLQGTGRRKKMSMLHHFKKLKKDARAMPGADRSLFLTIEVPTQVQCISFLI
ncbi:exocyst complex component 3-like protein 4 isoform X2 [Lissotriton helveticus]